MEKQKTTDAVSCIDKKKDAGAEPAQPMDVDRLTESTRACTTTVAAGDRREWANGTGSRVAHHQKKGVALHTSKEARKVSKVAATSTPGDVEAHKKHPVRAPGDNLWSLRRSCSRT